MYYTYILISEDGARTYTGVTSDIDRRLKEHNSGKEKSTRPHLPYKVLYVESHETMTSARRKEVYFKSTSGRREIRQFLINYKQGRL